MPTTHIIHQSSPQSVRRSAMSNPSIEARLAALEANADALSAGNANTWWLLWNGALVFFMQ